MCKNDAAQERYIFSEPKTKVQVYNSSIPTEVWNSSKLWDLNGKPIEVVDAHTHVGINRETKPLKNSLFISERIQLGRRAMYLLFRAGMHGLNGLNPAQSHNLWQTQICRRIVAQPSSSHNSQLPDREIRAIPTRHAEKATAPPTIYINQWCISTSRCHTNHRHIGQEYPYILWEHHKAT
jgi:hypothetical protein